ncbi:MAG: hypothetical protein R2745_17215 [Vicinamibacterales bacterium]
MTTVDDAIAAFRHAAIEKGAFAGPRARDHALHAAMAAAWRALHAQGQAGLQAFESLLNDESRFVRTWVAAVLISRGDNRGVAVLEADAEMRDRHGFSSQMVLREWRAKRLKCPFGEVDGTG